MNFVIHILLLMMLTIIVLMSASAGVIFGDSSYWIRFGLGIQFLGVLIIFGLAFHDFMKHLENRK